MERVLRFNDYDVFAYLATGFAAMLASDITLGSQWVLGAKWEVSESLAVLLTAYFIGHLIAWPAAWLLELSLVRRVLGAPSQALFSEAPSGPLAGVTRRLFPDYFTPLNQEIRERVTAKAYKEGRAVTSGENLFWIAFARAKRDPLTYGRMESFLKLYGFCRNVAFVGLAAAVLLLSHAVWLVYHAAQAAEVLDRLWWALVALLAGGVMLYRYLKFHRLYSVEVFTGYLELPSLEGRTSDACRNL
jgi:hypothetical protein